MDKELYEQLKRCHESGLNFYWGRRDDVEVDGLCFAYGAEDKRNNNCNHLVVRDALVDIFGKSYRYLGRRHYKWGGVFQLALTVSREEYEEMMSVILDEDKRASKERSERTVRRRYKHLLVPFKWLYNESKYEDILLNSDVIDTLYEGYIIKFTNTHCAPDGSPFMSITFELESESGKGKF